MAVRSFYFFVLLLALVPATVRADAAWSRLQLGMSPDETAATIGRPILQTSGRGYEIWTFDNGAEVLLYGTLVGWTAPGVVNVSKRSMDVWQANRTGAAYPDFLTLRGLPMSQGYTPIAPLAAPVTPAGGLRIQTVVNRRW